MQIQRSPGVYNDGSGAEVVAEGLSGKVQEGALIGVQRLENDRSVTRGLHVAEIFEEPCP